MKELLSLKVALLADYFCEHYKVYLILGCLLIGIVVPILLAQLARLPEGGVPPAGWKVEVLDSSAFINRVKQVTAPDGRTWIIYEADTGGCLELDRVDPTQNFGIEEFRATEEFR